MKLGVSHQTPDRLTPGRLAYLRQMGVESVEVRIPSGHSSVDDIIEIRRRVEDAGLELFEVMLSDKYSCEEIAIGGPDGESAIEEFSQFLERLGKAGVDTTTYAWHTGGVYKTDTTLTRGCRTRFFDYDAVRRGPNQYPRVYSAEEMWERYESFIARVLPVAEANGVRLQLHPNDPPVDHGGVARIFSSTGAYRRAMDIAKGNPYSGILFCVGCWAEMSGPTGEGEDIVAAIEEFGRTGRIFQVHFRNVDGHLPRFAETFPDDGYVDLVAIMSALQGVGFDGMVVPDHIPVPLDGEGSRESAEGYSLGYIRGLMQACRARG